MFENPKSQAIMNAIDEDEAGVDVAPKVEDTDIAEDDLAQELDAAEQKINRMEREAQLLRTTNPEKALDLENRIRQLRSNAAGGVPDATMLSHIELETDQAHIEENMKEAQELQETAGTAITALAGFGALFGAGDIANSLKLEDKVAAIKEGATMLKEGVSTAIANVGNNDRVNPGTQVAIMPSVDQGQGFSRDTAT